MAFKFSKDSVVSSVMLAASEATYLIKGYIYVSKELFHGIGNSALPLTMDAATILGYELCAGPVEWDGSYDCTKSHSKIKYVIFTP
jgi:hypothetical protein